MRRIFVSAVPLIVAGALAAACGAQSTDHERGSGALGGAGGGSGAFGTGAASGTGAHSGTGSGAAGVGGEGAKAGTGGSGGTLGGAGGSAGTSASGAGGFSASGGTGGSGARGGAGGTGGSAANGGASATGGTGGVCLCPATACLVAVTLMVEPQPGSGATVIQGLTAEGSGLNVTCTAFNGSTCEWRCESTDYRLADGDYSVMITAPGYSPKAVDFSITNPTNCGCCGCCPGTYQATVDLVPSGQPPTSGCCADLDNDVNNCGACGRKCPANGCSGGKCTPYFGACVVPGVSGNNCDEYCASIGQVCSASCGTNSDEASEEWSGAVQNCYDPMQTPTVHGCSDPFEKASPNSVPEYHCCCGDP